VLGDDGGEQVRIGIVLAVALGEEPAGLDEQAFAQVARAAADRVESLDEMQHLLGAGRGAAGLERERDERIRVAPCRPRHRRGLLGRLERVRRDLGRVGVGACGSRHVRSDHVLGERGNRRLQVGVHHQVAVAVQVADDEDADPLLLGRQPRHP
jgi:hypothetical protein